VRRRDGASARVAELHGRIEELEAQGDDRFGRFDAGDWLACILLALVVPALLIFRFAR
jgi:hypothetical protein